MVQAKTNLKEKAVALRKKGKTYSEILSQVPVAKSTLSLWLRDVGLLRPQKQRLTIKRKNAQKKGAAARHNQRLERTKQIYSSAEKEIGKISKRELWLMGIMLYWAEGAKEKSWRPGSGVEFSNSDARMIKIFLQWLYLCGIKKEDIVLKIHIHENQRNNIDKVLKYWIKQTGCSKKDFIYIYFKKHNPKTNRKNISSNYNGNLVVSVRKSSVFVRKIEGWVRGIVKK